MRKKNRVFEWAVQYINNCELLPSVGSKCRSDLGSCYLTLEYDKIIHDEEIEFNKNLTIQEKEAIE
jgi:hypothetical protein